MEKMIHDVDLLDIQENINNEIIKNQSPMLNQIKEFTGILKQYVKYNPKSYVAQVIDECEIVQNEQLVSFSTDFQEEKIDMICAGINDTEIIIQKQHKCKTYQVSCKDFISHFIWGEFGIDVVQEIKETSKDFFLNMKMMAKIIYDAKQKIKKRIGVTNPNSNEIITSKIDFDVSNSIEFLNELKETTAKKIRDVAFEYDLKNQNPFFKLIHEFNQANANNISSIKKILFIEIRHFFLDIILLRPIYQFCKFCFNGKRKLNANENKFNLYTEKNNNVEKIFFLLEVVCISILIFNIGLIFNILSGVCLSLIIFAMIHQRKKHYRTTIKKYLFNKVCLCVEPIIKNHDFLKDRANMLIKTFNTEINNDIKKLEQMRDKPKGFEKIHRNDNFDIRNISREQDINQNLYC